MTSAYPGTFHILKTHIAPETTGSPWRSEGWGKQNYFKSVISTQILDICKRQESCYQIS